MDSFVPFAASRGVKYPARKLPVMTSNKRPIPACRNNAMTLPPMILDSRK
jgi:hypothetical protein